MKKFAPIITFLLSLTSISQELSIPNIQAEVYTINSDKKLKHHVFDTNEIYNQTTDGGGSFEVWEDNGNIKKITQTLFLSNGQFITSVYLKNEQPILITETEKHFQWKSDNSGFDYDKELKSDYSEQIYAYNWNKDPIKVETKGESLRKETICGVSDYVGLLQTAKKIVE